MAGDNVTMDGATMVCPEGFACCCCCCCCSSSMATLYSALFSVMAKGRE